MVIIEGPRNVGKSFLLRGFPHFKFDLIDFCKEFNPNPSNFFYFSIGKDLMSLQAFKNQSILMDRGFLSSLVFGKLESRFNKTEEIEFINLIGTYLDEIKIVLVYGKNPKERKNKDLFDTRFAVYESQLDTYDYYVSNHFKSNTIYFENKFDLDSEYRFQSLIKELTD